MGVKSCSSTFKELEGEGEGEGGREIFYNKFGNTFEDQTIAFSGKRRGFFLWKKEKMKVEVAGSFHLIEFEIVQPTHKRN